MSVVLYSSVTPLLSTREPRFPNSLAPLQLVAVNVQLPSGFALISLLLTSKMMELADDASEDTDSESDIMLTVLEESRRKVGELLKR